MKLHTRFAQEFFIATALGSVPMFLVYSGGGLDGLDKFIKAAVPFKGVLYYLSGLIFPYLLIVFIDWFVRARTDDGRRIRSFWRSTLKETGAALLSLWRFLAGILLAVPLLWVMIEPETLQFLEIIYFVIVGSVLLFEAWVMSCLLFYFETNWKRPDPV
ncbi:hypothetical protein [Stutzerimonas kunmingensis]|uniref:hypothetical protein n=1 Tax=Stutzerimonas kunmingensis TaxID=1211807 RepID=UPI0028B137FF|nr:hypothetical protein [Stutzerimonas kunmingensis]